MLTRETTGKQYFPETFRKSWTGIETFLPAVMQALAVLKWLVELQMRDDLKIDFPKLPGAATIQREIA
ncbi:hypothetical protein ACFY36_10965 [Actinoplanes sp. NPDC000266]